ncbi:YkgJ family cysteine cluster protein [Candidatus Bathyarchaeota archaeon]|nr:YkgJ family cysteine cluster protein [Candidatus Bathyarchaeota archaeon]
MRQIALWRCIRCGECCRHMVGKKFGMALLPEEAKRLKVLASRRGVSLHLKPLTWNGFKVTLYQFAEPVCPFLTRNGCSIYRWRPLACKMYPLHPYGVSDCTFMDRMQRRGFHVIFPPQLEAAGKRYIRLVVPRIKEATYRYNLNRGWESNTCFTFKPTCCSTCM